MKILLVSADRTTRRGHPQNIGDALLTDALAEALGAAGHDVRVADLASERRAESPVARISVPGLAGLRRAVASADAVVIGGGTLLADDQPQRLFAGLPRLCLTTSLLAVLHRKKLAVFGVGVDPVGRRRARAAIRLVLRLAAVWVRDADSAGRASRLLGGRSVRVSGDVSLAALAEIAAREVPASDRAGVVVALNRREAALLRTEDVERLRSRHGSVRFLSMDQGADADSAHLARDVAQQLSVVDGPVPWTRAVAEIAGAEAVVASRMHAMYIACMVSVPVVAVGDAPKVRTFVADFGVAHATGAAEACSTEARTEAARTDAQTAKLSGAMTELEEWLDGAH